MIFNPVIKGGKATLSWHQCPEAVRNYLAYVAEHPYSSDDYTSSVIENFAPTPAVIGNTKPIGQAVDGTTFYNEIPNIATPYAVTSKAGTLTPLDMVRWINSRTNNMRDIGGWPCDGGTIKYGLIYRCGEISAQDEDLFVNRLGIKTEIDLTADGVPAFGGGKMRFVCAPEWAMYSLAPVDTWRTNLKAIFESVKYGEAVVFHCSMGADRTGTLACVIEGLLGVSQNNLDADYELTSFFTLRRRDTDYQGGGGAKWERLINQIKALHGTTFRDKCVNFVASLGFTAAEINAFRASIIDGTPETVAPSVNTYTVTNTLSNVTTDNAAVSASQYQPYAAILTPAANYNFDEVEITMNGVSVKAATYEQIDYPIKIGKINIDRVTGNIVVTAKAVQIAPSYTNQIPISTDSSGNVYNVTGYKDGYRINSSGAETAYSGAGLTGYIPFRLGDTIRVKQFNSASGVWSYTGYFFFKADHSIIGRATQYGASQHYPSSAFIANGVSEWTPTSSEYNGASGAQMDLTNAAYIRLCIGIDSNPSADWICTINQEIT